MISIYALINPLNQHVFYVGAANNPHERLTGHISSSHKNYNAKSIIINEIVNNGLKPEMLLLEECELEQATFFEDFYICLFRSYGFTLRQKNKSSYTLSIKTRTGITERQDKLRGIGIHRETHALLVAHIEKIDGKIGKWTDKAILEKLARESKKEKNKWV